MLAATGVYGFITVARDAEARRACVPLCAMHPNYAADNRSAPDFELSDMKGRPVKLSSYRGKTVVLNFWTKTCGPCLEEMPSLVELTKVLAPRKDIVVLTVSTDAGPAAVEDTLRTVLHEPPPFAVLFDAESDVVGGRYGTHLFPETWIIDPDGIIRARFDGGRDWSNALVVDLIDSFSKSAACSIEFHGARPVGPEAAICEDSDGSG